MTRKELIAGVTEELNREVVADHKVSKSTVERVVNAMFDKVLTNALAEGVTVKINDFGSFEPVVKAARTGRNPQTGEAIEIDEKMGIKFKPASALKEKMN